MATIGKLVVSLSANSAKLITELKRSQKQIKKWAKEIKSVTLKAAKAFGAVGAVLGGGLLVAINRNAAAIDDMTKAAGKLKFPIEDYQKFAFMAAKSNISMDLFGRSVQRMMKSIGDARSGLKTASDALAELNLNADDLAKLNPSEQFQLIADSMARIPTQADKVKIAMDLFGRSGADLLNMFNGGMKDLAAEFDSLGVTITQRQADMVAAYQDAKTSLGTLLSGFGRNLTAEIAPALTEIVNQTTEWIKKMGGMKVVANRFARSVISGIIGIIKGFSSVINAARNFGVELIDLQAKWLAFKSVVTLDNIFNAEDVRRQFDQLAQERFNLKVKIQQDGKSNFGGQIIKNLQTILDNVGKETANITSRALRFNNAQHIVATQAQKTAASLSKLSESADKAAPNKANISEQFKQYFKLAQNDLRAGSTYAADKINVLQNLLKSAQNSNVNLSGQTVNNETINAMRDMINSLQSVSANTVSTAQSVAAVKQSQPQQMGSLTLNMVTDTGEISGRILAYPAFINSIRELVQRQINNTARAAGA